MSVGKIGKRKKFGRMDDFVFKMTALLGIVLSLSILIPLAIHKLFPITN